MSAQPKRARWTCPNNCGAAQFIAPPAFVERVLAFKPHLYLGEVLGKHSEIWCTLGVDGKLTEEGLANTDLVHGIDILDRLIESTKHPDEKPSRGEREYGWHVATWVDWNKWVEGLTEHPGMTHITSI